MMHNGALTRVAATCATLMLWRLAAAATPEPGASGEALEEGTVTAQKQVENLQKRTAEVTAIPADALGTARINDLRQGQSGEPSVRVPAAGNTTHRVGRGRSATLR